MIELENQIFELSLSIKKSIDDSMKGNKLLFFIDHSTVIESLALVEYLKIKQFRPRIYLENGAVEEKVFDYFKSKLQSDVIILPDFTEEEIQPILKKETMGTKLFLFGYWKMVIKIKKVAQKIGFLEPEIIVCGIGEKEERVFCVRCYHQNKKNDQPVLTCEKCSTILDVSNHYSKRHDAYLGYIKV
jgi:hypothetical protein